MQGFYNPHRTLQSPLIIHQIYRYPSNQMLLQSRFTSLTVKHPPFIKSFTAWLSFTKDYVDLWGFLVLKMVRLLRVEVVLSTLVLEKKNTWDVWNIIDTTYFYFGSFQTFWSLPDKHLCNLEFVVPCIILKGLVILSS